MRTQELWQTPEYIEGRLLEEQKHVDFDIKEFPVEVIVAKLLNGDMEIPTYQREFVWDDPKQVRFIESVLLGLPIPYLFAADIPKSGKLEVIDGVQRIRTLEAYLADKLVLNGLDKLGFLDGLRYSDLPPSQQRRFRNRTLRMIVLTERSDQDVRFDIFERINTGSVILSPAELRRGAFPGGFYDLVRRCAESSEFKRVCPLPQAKMRRREGEELTLRFFAYRERYRQFDHDVSKFLNQYLRDKNEDPPAAEPLHSAFVHMLSFVERHFPNKFAKTPTGSAVPRVRFEAIAVGTHLALNARPSLRPRNMGWLESADFRTLTTTDASNSGPKLKARIEYVRDRLLEVAA